MRDAVEAALVEVNTPWGTKRVTRVFKHSSIPNSSSSTLGRPPPCSNDTTRKCLLLQLHVRAPDGDWLSSPRDTSDIVQAVNMRFKVCDALEKRGYKLVEACLLNAAFHDDGTKESDFSKIAIECANASGAEVKLASRFVDPGLGLVIAQKEYADQAWEQPGTA